MKAHRQHSSGSGRPTGRGYPVARWTTERLVADGDQWFSEMIADIAAARGSVTYEIYIIQHDHTGGEVVAALEAAAARGVRVRLLVDGVGSPEFIWKVAPRLLESRLEVRVYHPLPTQVLSPAFRHGSRLLGMLRLLPLINHRDHRKVCVIDDRIAWVGSYNAADFTRRSLNGDDVWREAGARVTGEGVAELVEAFTFAWQRSWRFHRRHLSRHLFTKRQPTLPPSGCVRLNHRIRLRLRNHLQMVQYITTAKTRVWIVAAYFVPGHRLLKALTNAASRGVDVRLLMSRKSDVAFMPAVAAAFTGALIRRGMRVYEFSPGILHAKALLIDDWLSLGSTNLNMRSLLHDLEADVVLQDPASRASFIELFHMGLARSQVVNADFYSDRPWHWRMMGRLALWFKYYI